MEQKELQKTLKLAVIKKPGEASGTIAISKSGHKYSAGSLASDTNFLNISSEQSALALSTLNQDYGVTKLVSIAELPESEAVSPAILKIIVDYSIRTGHKIGYKILNTGGKIIFETKDVSKNIGFYKPAPINLARTANAKPANNWAKAVIKKPLDLRAWAIKGLERNFPLYDSASSYGTAVATKSGKVYFGGQYSSPDKRLGLHSEITTIISAIANGDSEIEKIGIVSSKYIDSPCDMCGICRQFIAEISAKFGITPDLYCFSKEAPDYKKHKIKDYLPSVWTSKKWTK